ncbi:MAG: SDR family NAD(P)-dependent oxidoreductase [Chlorobiaceae bacterium]|nr:SDR family NAD(P)-dependent oxidoreductase [Chlorobiaceae bacterium]
MGKTLQRIAIVTGATSGIGEATVRLFVSSGYGVVGCGRRTEKIASLQRELGESFAGVIGDASEESVIDRLFTKAEERFGREADLVVVNAGRGLKGSVSTTDLSELQEVFDINVKGALMFMQKASQQLVALQEGRFPEKAADVVVVGSVVGRHVFPLSTVYGSTKFALHALAEGLRREIGPKGVRVSLVEPGIVVSGFQDAAGYGQEVLRTFRERFGPLLDGEDVARAILTLVSQPPHVHFSDIVVRPVRQDYP